jgi:zinc transport system substrate-binding protein
MILMRLLSAAAAVAFAAAGCGSVRSSDDGRVEIVASFYPLSWAAERVGGDRVAVTNLTPPGVEPHDIELSPEQVVDVADARVAIVLGGAFQPAVEAAAADRREPTLVVLDELDATPAGATDPHVWLDPVLMRAIVDAVEATLVEVDPQHRSEYRERGDDVRTELEVLDAAFSAGLADCERRDLFTAHDAFGWLAARYDLRVESIAGLSPDEEPSPARLAELAQLVEETGTTTIFVETLLSPEIAETLADEAGGLRTAVLDPLEGLDEDAIRGGAAYPSVMRDNLTALRAGLDCR